MGKPGLDEVPAGKALMTRRQAWCALGGGLAGALAGCTPARVTLRDVLGPARGAMADRHGRDVDVDGLLSAARNRPVTLTFGYIGCGGRVPLIGRIRSAAGTAGQPCLDLVFDAIDEPDRYAELVRDIMGDGGGVFDEDATRVVFIRKDELWPRQGNKAVEAMLHRMGVRFGRESFLQTIKQTGLFDDTGELKGTRFL